MTWRVERPGDDELAPFYKGYVDDAPTGDVVRTLESQVSDTLALLEDVPESRANHPYAPGKWSIKEVVGHLTDSERVFVYRALRFARADATPLPGFDETAWVPAGNFGGRALAELVDEFAAVRRATVAFFDSLGETAARRRGTANEQEVSVRALAWIVAGHERHHVRILRERYLGGG